MVASFGLCLAQNMKVTFLQDLQRRIGVETRLKGYKYFEIERDFFNKLGVLIAGDFKFGCTATCFCSFPWR